MSYFQRTLPRDDHYGAVTAGTLKIYNNKLPSLLKAMMKQ